MKSYWSSRLSEIVTALVVMSPILSFGQFSRPDESFGDNEKYLYPINPGQPGSLAGTMGELRSTHFHSGIDIRTDNRVGYAVRASKSGYISRVTVSPSGYGNVLYITHGDGNTTLYAHLQKFSGPVAEYVLDEQYRQRSASVDLFLRPDQFVVRQGDTIAISGNSGSSSGPHLHFDIRNPENYALNPLEVEGFPEIVDNQPPAVEKIALKTLDINSRINDRFGRFEFHAKRVGNDFVLPVPILAYGNIGIEILAKDKLAPKSPFYGGVNHIEMSVNDRLVFNQSIDKINIAEGRGIFTLMDFKTQRLKGDRYYKLYIDDGNDLPFYDRSPTSGKIKVAGNEETAVRVRMKDTFGNASELTFRMKPSPPSREVPFLEPMNDGLEYDIIENTAIISVAPCNDSAAVVYLRTGEKTLARPQYYNSHRAVYLIDLRKQLPDSVSICGRTIATNLKTSVPPGHEYNYYSDRMDIQFPQESVYDTIYLTTYHTITADSIEVFNIGSRTNPLGKAINVTIRPDRAYDWEDRYGVYRMAGKGYSYVGGGWLNGGIHFSTREFGDFVILQDVEAPSVKPVAVNNYVARFKIKDNLSGINRIEATIDGQWLLMHYDPKTSSIWSQLRDEKKPLKGNLVLTVTDMAGNEATYSKQIP